VAGQVAGVGGGSTGDGDDEQALVSRGRGGRRQRRWEYSQERRARCRVGDTGWETATATTDRCDDRRVTAPAGGADGGGVGNI